jgi:hypothetical protein
MVTDAKNQDQAFPEQPIPMADQGGCSRPWQQPRNSPDEPVSVSRKGKRINLDRLGTQLQG